MTKHEIEIQTGDETETVYIAAKTAEAAVSAAKASATPTQRRWARFVITGR